MADVPARRTSPREYLLVASAFLLIGSDVYIGPGCRMFCALESLAYEPGTEWFGEDDVALATMFAVAFGVAAVVVAWLLAGGRVAWSTGARWAAGLAVLLWIPAAAVILWTVTLQMSLFQVIAAAEVAPKPQELVDAVAESEFPLQIAGGLMLTAALTVFLLAARSRRATGISWAHPIKSLTASVVTLGGVLFLTAWLGTASRTAGVADLLVAEPPPRPSDFAAAITQTHYAGVGAALGLAIMSLGLSGVLLMASPASHSSTDTAE
jgi:hypothetical protein